MVARISILQAVIGSESVCRLWQDESFAAAMETVPPWVSSEPHGSCRRYFGRVLFVCPTCRFRGCSSCACISAKRRNKEHGCSSAAVDVPRLWLRYQGWMFDLISVQVSCVSFWATGSGICINDATKAEPRSPDFGVVRSALHSGGAWIT